MCTLSIIRDDVLRIAMNRDELDRRPQALPPRFVDYRMRRAIMPIDPQSRGTWIAVNDAGLVLAVLNRNASSPGAPGEGRGEGLSRGTIIPALLDADCVDDAVERVAHLSLELFNPFRLIAADRSTVVSMTWDSSRTFVEHHPDGPLMFTSSGLGDDLVERPRRTLFKQLMWAIDSPRVAQDAFHHHRWTDRPHLSVNMIRPGARTVSRTTIEITYESILIRYQSMLHGDTHAARLSLANREAVMV
jgi:hypothetical protein